MLGFVIKGDICFCTDKDVLKTYKDSYAVCVDSVCQGVYKELPQQYRELPLYDYTDKLIIPGLVDLHTHAPQYSFCGLGMDKELLDWLESYAFLEEAKYNDLSYAQKAYSIFCDSLSHSATTRACIFATLHKEATTLLMDEMEKTGMVSFVGKVNMDRNSPDTLLEKSAQQSIDDTKAWLDDVKDKYSNTYPIITPRFIPSCSDELMQKLGDLQKEYHVPVQSHLSENPDEIKWVSELCPNSKNYGDAYAQFGLFGGDAKTVMAHCVYSDDEEIELLKQNGVFVAHCPASNSNIASGIAPIRRYLDKGLKVGLGSDMAGGNTESLFSAIVEAIKVSKLYYRLVDNTVKPLKFTEVFYLATKGGGEFFGKVGSFEKGYEFDAVVIDDSVLPHPQELGVSQRLERCVYRSADLLGLTAKFVKGKKTI